MSRRDVTESARRSFGRCVAAARSARAALVLQWRDAGQAERLQVLAAAGLALVVFALFAVGALTRTVPGKRSDALPLAAARDSRPAAHRKAPAAKRRGPLGHSRHAASHPVQATTFGGGSPRTPARSGKRPPVPSPRQPKLKPPKQTPARNAASGGDTPVVVGVAYRAPSVAAGLAAALGLGDAPPDAAAQARAVAAWVNDHGGVAGRRLELRLAAYDPALASSYAESFAAACAAVATGALRPVAVVSALEDAPVQSGCLAGRGIPLVGESPAPGDGATFAAAGPYLFAPASMALDRLAAGQVRILARAGFFAGPARVGVLRLAGAEFDRADRDGLQPALAAVGAKVVADETLPRGFAASDAPLLLARALAAVLDFQRAGVNRVLMLDAGVAAPVFMREAERLGFRPRYGLNSSMVPAALPGNVPAAQLEGAIGAGFAPLLDVAADGEPKAPAARRRCEDIYRGAGVALGPRTAEGAFAAIGLCDAILSVKAAVEQAGDDAAAPLAAAFERLGRRLPAAVALASRLTNQQHDGAAELRPVAFDDRCTCMRYSGPAEAAQ